MKILLVNPPNSGRSIPEERYGIDTVKMVFRGEPLALETLAGCLDARHEVALVDLKVEPQALGGLLDAFKPDLVGVTGMTCEANASLAIARQAKAAGVRWTVVGGHHASNDPAFFNQDGVDFVAIGLAGRSFPDLVEDLEQGGGSDIPWMAPTQPGGTLAWSTRPYGALDMAEDRPPRYDLVERYRSEYYLVQSGARLGFAVSAMGCTHACAFCAIPNLTDGKYFVRSPKAVARDVSLLDTPMIRLVDANTFGDASQAAELCRDLAARGVKRRYIADVRADTVVGHPELMRTWKEAGLSAVIIGFEEIDDARLAKMNKRSSAELNRQAIAILKGLGVGIVGDFIIDPQYEAADFDAVERFVAEMGIDLPIPSILTPMPGTPLYRQRKDQLTITDLDYYTFSNAVLPTRLPLVEFYQRYTSMIRKFHAPARAANASPQEPNRA